MRNGTRALKVEIKDHITGSRSLQRVLDSVSIVRSTQGCCQIIWSGGERVKPANKSATNLNHAHKLFTSPSCQQWWKTGHHYLQLADNKALINPLTANLNKKGGIRTPFPQRHLCVYHIVEHKVWPVMSGCTFMLRIDRVVSILTTQLRMSNIDTYTLSPYIGPHQPHWAVSAGQYSVITNSSMALLQVKSTLEGKLI